MLEYCWGEHCNTNYHVDVQCKNAVVMILVMGNGIVSQTQRTAEQALILSAQPLFLKIVF